MSDLKSIIEFIRGVYGGPEMIPLHAPRFFGNEKVYLEECVDSTFVSSVGAFVNRFEEMVADYTGARHAIAVVNGTQALYVSLKLLGVERGDIVITQSLTFVATANAIAYIGAKPAFVDVDEDTLGMSPDALREFLETQCEAVQGQLRFSKTGEWVRAVVPMHTFGNACRISEIKAICDGFGLTLIEDAAESLGSYATGNAGKRHTGTIGDLGTLSFNGNKIITTGGGGMILTDDEELGKRARHLTTTAKVPHAFEFIHDEVGYNFRMPNLNAALGVAQMERLPLLLKGQRKLADRYREFFGRQKGVRFLDAPACSESNFWMNAIRFDREEDRNEFLTIAKREGVGSRAVWRPMHLLPMFADCPRGALERTEDAYKTVVNIPSTVPVDFIEAGSGIASEAS